MSARKTAAAKGEDAGQPSFEAAMNRLELIVLDMESGTLSLEDMIARFEEGQTLLTLCTRKLDEVEKKVEILVKQGDKVVAQPFATEGEADEAPAGKSEDADELF